MQGALRQEFLEIKISTLCGHCDQQIQLTIDSRLRSRVQKGKGAEPLIFRPHVDWERFTDPNIIHGF